MNNWDSIDAIAIFIVFTPVLMAAFFARFYIKKINELNYFSSDIAKNLNLNNKLVDSVISDSSLYLKLFVTFLIFGWLTLKIEEHYTDYYSFFQFGSPLIFIVVVIVFYGKSNGVDTADAYLIAVRILNKISEANRINNIEKAENLSKIFNFISSKFSFSETDDGLKSEKYISYVDTLYGAERVEYQSKIFINKVITAVKLVLPVIGIIVAVGFLKVAFR
jgi:hypothetical protein